MKRTLLPLTGLFLGLFLVFTLIVQRHVFDGLDIALTIKIQTLLHPWIITIFSIFSLLGAAEVISWTLLPFLKKYRWQSWPIFGAYAGGSLIELVGKTMINHASPPHIFFRYDLGVKFPSSYLETLHSYPSGHVFRTTFIIACWLIILFRSTQGPSQKKLLGLVAAIFCVIMLVSRVALGEHWTTDVIGGLLLGFGMAFGSFLFIESPRLNQLTRKIHHASQKIFTPA